MGYIGCIYIYVSGLFQRSYSICSKIAVGSGWTTSLDTSETWVTLIPLLFGCQVDLVSLDSRPYTKPHKPPPKEADLANPPTIPVPCSTNAGDIVKAALAIEAQIARSSQFCSDSLQASVELREQGERSAPCRTLELFARRQKARRPKPNHGQICLRPGSISDGVGVRQLLCKKPGCMRGFSLHGYNNVGTYMSHYVGAL